MYKLPLLKPGDNVEIIAPASRCSDQELSELKELLDSWGLNCKVASDIFGKDLFFANRDEVRFAHLKRVLHDPKISAIICARGGYGSMRLIPKLSKIDPPKSPKMFMGMSDITALHLYFQQQWQWPTIHGACAPSKFSPDSISAVKSILFGKVHEMKFAELLPLNQSAKQNRMIESCVTGGNLSIVQASIGTLWQIDMQDKIVLLEEIGERAYRVDRMLSHLSQANVFKDAAAILFADFIKGNEPDGSSLIEPVLNRFAESCEIPVVRMKGIGHGYVNFPIPFGTSARLQLGAEVTLVCDI